MKWSSVSYLRVQSTISPSSTKFSIRAFDSPPVLNSREGTWHRHGKD